MKVVHPNRAPFEMNSGKVFLNGEEYNELTTKISSIL